MLRNWRRLKLRHLSLEEAKVKSSLIGGGKSYATSHWRKQMLGHLLLEEAKVTPPLIGTTRFCRLLFIGEMLKLTCSHLDGGQCIGEKLNIDCLP